MKCFLDALASLEATMSVTQSLIHSLTYIFNFLLSTFNQQLKTNNQQPITRNQQPETNIQQPTTWKPEKLKTWKPKPKNLNLKA